jgi:SAM-dependent methyltransferase
MTVPDLIASFVTVNRRWSGKIQSLLPTPTALLDGEYDQIVRASRIGLLAGTISADIGAGRGEDLSPERGSSLSPSSPAYRLAIDIDLPALRQNRSSDASIVADASSALPLRDGQVDLVTSRTVIEHLADTEAFVKEVARVLKSGGRTIHFLPSRYAPFALINRALPTSLARSILYGLYPDSQEVAGYKAFYDKCSPSDMQLLLERAGLIVTTIKRSYYQAHYFSFFAPAYALVAVYDWLMWRTTARNLCACFVIEAVKPDDGLEA